MQDNITLEWLKSAENDLRTIEHIIDDRYLTGVVAFHAQQCTEKCFKAVLESKNRKVPKEHSLVKLYLAIKDDLVFAVDMDILDLLNELYIDSRYPGEFGLLPNGTPTRCGKSLLCLCQGNP